MQAFTCILHWTFILWELTCYESTHLPPCHHDRVPALPLCLEESQLLLILLLVGVRDARVKMSQCTNVASPTRWMQGLGSEREQAECAYIFQDNQIVLGLVWVRELLWCLSAAQLALSLSLLCQSLSSLFRGELGLLWSQTSQLSTVAGTISTPITIVDRTSNIRACSQRVLWNVHVAHAKLTDTK